MKYKLTLALATALMLTACHTPQNITYFQGLHEGQIVKAEKVLSIKVKPEDKLSIMVNTQDPALSMLFNLVQSQNRLQGTTQTVNTLGTSTGSTTGQVSFYTVNPEGNIEFPVLGTLHVAGMTRFEVAEYIHDRLVNEDLVKDPIVTVEFGNTGITVLGEVGAPGRYEFNKDRLTLLDAIAMAGDLNINGLRDNVMVMREDERGNQTVHYVNLLDPNQLYASPVYYMQQNDVVYVAPNDKVKRQTTATGDTPYTPAFWMSVGSFVMTIAALVISLTK